MGMASRFKCDMNGLQKQSAKSAMHGPIERDKLLSCQGPRNAKADSGFLPRVCHWVSAPEKMGRLVSSKQPVWPQWRRKVTNVS